MWRFVRTCPNYLTIVTQNTWDSCEEDTQEDFVELRQHSWIKIADLCDLKPIEPQCRALSEWQTLKAQRTCWTNVFLSIKKERRLCFPFYTNNSLLTSHLYSTKLKLTPQKASLSWYNTVVPINWGKLIMQWCPLLIKLGESVLISSCHLHLHNPDTVNVVISSNQHI